MTSHMPMGTARQPFAPLNSSRLQNMTSIKNRQNGMPKAHFIRIAVPVSRLLRFTLSYLLDMYEHYTYILPSSITP